DRTVTGVQTCALPILDWLTELLQGPHEWIVVPQNHLMVQFRVNPPFHDALDIAEVAYHVPIVQRTSTHFDFRDRVMAVRMLADEIGRASCRERVWVWV